MQKLWVFFHPAFVWRPRDRVMHHLVAETNPALVTVRQLARHDFCWQHVAVTYGLVEACYLSNRTREINYVFPLFLDEGTVNISVTAMTAFSTYCDSSDVSERASTIFDYVYGLLSHPAYQRRYRSALAVDFPRVPLPSSRSEFMRLAERGRGLRQIVQQPLPEMGSIGEGGRPSEVALTALAQHVGVGQRCVDYELGAYRVVDQWVRRFGAEGLADIMRRIDATMAVQNESL